LGGTEQTNTWFFVQLCSSTTASKECQNASEVLIMQSCNFHIWDESARKMSIEISILLIFLNSQVLEPINNARAFFRVARVLSTALQLIADRTVKCQVVRILDRRWAP